MSGRIIPYGKSPPDRLRGNSPSLTHWSGRPPLLTQAQTETMFTAAASSADPRSSKRTVAPASEAQRPAKKNAPAQAAADAEAAPATEAEPVAEEQQTAGVGIVIERYFGPSEPEAASPLLARWLTSPDLPAICLV